MQTVVLTGADRALGRRVAKLLGDDPAVGRIIRLGAADLSAPPDLAGEQGELKRVIDGADVLVHLHDDPADTRAVLDAAGATGVEHVVLLSSATVYGARAGNPMPLTEEAPLQPCTDLPHAVEAAERERLTADFQAAHPGVTVSVLRTAVPVAEDDDSWLARALHALDGLGSGGDAGPVQFVHLDDLAAAADLARRRRLDGPYNVAPDGWLDRDARQALAGMPRIRLPDRVANRFAAWRFRLGLGAPPPGLPPYARHPWVVANGLLRAEGWEPRHTNEEAYVAGHRPAPWATISPRRRQELALGAVAIGGLGLLIGLVLVVRRIRRRCATARTLPSHADWWVLCRPFRRRVTHRFQSRREADQAGASRRSRRA